MKAGVLTRNAGMEDYDGRTVVVHSQLVCTGSASKPSITISSDNPGVTVVFDNGSVPTTTPVDAGVTYSGITSTASSTPSIVGVIFNVADSFKLLALEVTGISGTGAMTGITFTTATGSTDFTTSALRNIAVNLSCTSLFLNSAINQTFTLRATYLRQYGK